MKRFLFICCLGLVASTFHSCRNKDNDDSPVPVIITPLKVNMNFNAAGDLLLFDTLKFQNVAGNVFSVQRLDFYISNIEVTNSNGRVFKSARIYYVSARDTTTHHFSVNDIPVSGMINFKCDIGLNPTQNISNALPATPANLNMAWPDNMGGGYHFLKLEGHYLASNLQSYGYTMHLGKSQNLVKIEIPVTLTQTQAAQGLQLTMDVAKWFNTPNVFDLNVTNYTMGIDSLMTKLAQNGKHVLSITN